MKKVVEVHEIDGEYKYVINEVPEDWRMCSVLQKYFPYESFCRNGQLDRTNSEETYQLPFGEMQKLSDEVKMYCFSDKGVNDYRRLLVELETQRMQNYLRNTTKVKDLIEKLKEFDQELPVVYDNTYFGAIEPFEEVHKGVKVLCLGYPEE